jgi:hypothetical protein
MSDNRDHVSRVKRPSPVGTSLFVGLRSLDVFVQYGILAKGIADPLLNRLSISTIPSNSAAVVALGLPLKPLVVFAMAAGTAIKQIYWISFLSQEEMPPANAIPIAIFNTLFNSINSILSLTAAASYFTPSFSFLGDEANEAGVSPLFILGTISYIAGTAIETISEIQRNNFKADPRNAGKPYTGGLFSLARHINYGAYTLMRSGYALASGGWIWSSIAAAFLLHDFASRGVPVLDDYCMKKASQHPFRPLKQDRADEIQ